MNGTWPSAIAWALGNGPFVAGLAAFAISPGCHALIAATLERRRVRPRQEFAAVAIGDPLLTLAVGIGVALSPQGVNSAARPITLGIAAALTAGGWLCFGIWQWRAEIRRGYYSRDQAFAPTKIWHQLGVYPLLGTLACCSVLSGWAAPLGESAVPRVLGKTAIALLILAWVAANFYDRRHPRLGHPPYSWRSLRPVAQPWPENSETLRSYRSPQPRSEPS